MNFLINYISNTDISWLLDFAIIGFTIGITFTIAQKLVGFIFGAPSWLGWKLRHFNTWRRDRAWEAKHRRNAKKAFKQAERDAKKAKRDALADVAEPTEADIMAVEDLDDSYEDEYESDERPL